MTASSVQLGFVASAHGLRGEVLVRLHSPGSDALDRVSTLELKRPDSSATFGICAARPHKDGWLLTLEGVSTREAAVGLRGCTVHVPTSALPPLDEGEFYLDTVIGYRMVDAAAGDLGEILGVLTTTIDMLVVRDAQGRELIVPLLDGVVEEVDHTGRTVQVTVPDGLLD